MRKQSPFLNVVVRKFTGAARRLNPRPSESLPSSPSIRGNAVAAPPPFSAAGRAVHSPPQRAEDTASYQVWLHEDRANEPSPLHCFGESRTLWTLGARVVLVLALLIASWSTQAAVREVGAIGLTVNDLGRELNFFTNTLPFELVAISDASGKEQDALLGLSDARLRIATLKLGNENVTLTEHLSKKGRPIPQDSRSFDRWFQHIAIAVSDMDKAYARLLEHKVTHVSTAPQTLPEWNKDAGGIKAFYFRDPEDHVLEIIWFPPGKGNPKWQQPMDKPESGRPLFLGIDHTAIVVSHTDKSLAFYRDQLGFKVVGGAHNYGTEQEHLNQVFGANLRITALKAERGPGIEFLEYIAPPGGRDLPADAKANDLVFWNTQLFVDDPTKLSESLGEGRVRFISKPGESRSQVVRDPDGHALTLQVPSSCHDRQTLDD